MITLQCFTSRPLVKRLLTSLGTQLLILSEIGKQVASSLKKYLITVCTTCSDANVTKHFNYGTISRQRIVTNVTVIGNQSISLIFRPHRSITAGYIINK